jgi:methylenetetrahydrofolate reductase (NADPH)
MLQESRRSRRHHKPIDVSFEFFPPKSPEMETALWEAIERLAPLRPNFVSVTYGAGGSTRERTHATVARILRETAIKPAGYANSTELVRGLRAIGDFEISVAAYPEKHPESASFEQDIDVLKAKIDAGATRAITQFFFENDLYFRFLDRVRAAGITIPIVPGVTAVQNFKQTANFAKRAGASVPDWLGERFAGLDDDPQTRRLIAAAVAAEQVFDLLDRGVEQFHFYTMNRADLVYAVCHLLGARAMAPVEPVPI